MLDDGRGKGTKIVTSKGRNESAMFRFPPVGKQDGYTHQMSYDGSSRGTNDAPIKPLDEDDIKTKIDHIVNNNCHRDQFGLTIHTHHRGESPHKDEGRITYQQHLHITTSQRQNLLIAAKQACRLVWENDATKEGKQQSEQQTERQGMSEKPPSFLKVFLSQCIAHQHARTCIDQQVEREDELIDGF